jgi:hypothetical protein
MRNIMSPTILAVLIALLPGAAPAQAQLARTFVSALGSDANDCNRFTPCRTFQRAHDNTLDQGEITVLDPGGYGAVIITKAISIINDGVGEAGMLVSGGVNGITVNGGTTAAVSLKGLTIKGIGFGGGNGIVFLSGKSLTVENCTIRNLTLAGEATGRGIVFTTANASKLAVSSTLIADNENDGILVTPAGSGIVRATLNRVELYNNGNEGLFVSVGANTASARVTVADSMASRNRAAGFHILIPGGPGQTSSLMVVRSVTANNGTGLAAAGINAALRIGQSAVTGNSVTSSRVDSALLLSFGDNYISGNGDSDPAPPVIAKK